MNDEKDGIDGLSIFIGMFLGIVLTLVFIIFTNASISIPRGQMIQFSSDFNFITPPQDKIIQHDIVYDDIMSAKTFSENSYTFYTSEHTSVVIGFVNSLSYEYFTQLQNAIYEIPFVTAEQMMNFKVGLEADPNIVYIEFSDETETVLRDIHRDKVRQEFIISRNKEILLRADTEIREINHKIEMAKLRKELAGIQ